MPAAVSLTRSRRARSSGGRFPSSAPSARGSATIRSCPVAASASHRQVTGSSPARDRKKVTRAPSGDTSNARGTPSVNLRVRACCLGKLSVMLPIMPARAAACRLEGAPGRAKGSSPGGSVSGRVCVESSRSAKREARSAMPAPGLATPRHERDTRLERSLLLVHAHPDDESIGTGATMAKYAAEGARVTLVTCTLGELGEIIPPDLSHLFPDELGQHRIVELDRACAALGVADHRFLGGEGRYRDSGMMGLPDNDDPRCFWQAGVDEAADAL